MMSKFEMVFSSFPVYLWDDISKVMEILPNKTINNKTINNVSDVFCGESTVYVLPNYIIDIPYRLYLLDVEDFEYKKLNQIQKQIVCCMYTRSCDGYIREKYLTRLLDMPFELWSIPYIVKLCDEYVVEILKIIYDKLKEWDNKDIQRFCLMNKVSINKSYSRMVSYWNEYYRKDEFDFKKYIGRNLFEECLGYDRHFESN